MEQTGFSFVPPHNPDNYPQSTGIAQEQALGTENFQQNQALFRKYTAVNGALKKQIVTLLWKQSSYTHRWINSQVSDRCTH